MDAKASENKLHWEAVFERKSPTEVSWYKPHLDISLQLIMHAGVLRSSPIIDIGGGDSPLVDDLLRAGYLHITVLDISAVALERARARVGPQANAVTWLEADIIRVALPANSYDVWHDRAMFHFLTDEASRMVYVRSCEVAVKPGGTLIVATFAPDGPDRCSGLPTMKYGPRDLEREFGADFELVEAIPELHTTPQGKTQSFVYCRFMKRNTEG